jgi:hypothetical protein
MQSPEHQRLQLAARLPHEDKNAPSVQRRKLPVLDQ